MATALLPAAPACGPRGTPPDLADIGDQVVAVGEELVVLLRASDADGDDLYFSFRGGPDGLTERADIFQRADGAAEFRFVPLAADVGAHSVDFLVTDLDHTSQATIALEVTAASSKDSVPRFISPLGNGTAIDLATVRCSKLDIVVQDFDSTEVDILQVEPIIAGAELESTGPMTARWSWCPSPEQIASDDRYTLTLAADDGDNEPSVKPYLLVLRTPPDPSCDGTPPVVTHVPQDISSTGDIRIVAEIEDDLGLSDLPLLYYSTESPSEPVDLGTMVQLTMSLESGDMVAGTWAATVPNPVAGGSAGSSSRVHYVIVTNDEDEPGCRRALPFPATGSLSMNVTNPGTIACVDDASENDDGPTQARSAPVFPDPFGSTANQICAADDDWYRVELFTGETLVVDLVFEHTDDDEDLDLHLLDASLTDLTPCSESAPSTCSAAQGQSTTSNEHVEALVNRSGCAPCRFYVVVHGWAGSENDYAIRMALE